MSELRQIVCIFSSTKDCMVPDNQQVAVQDSCSERNVPCFLDYDAPLTEAGEYTPKYHLLRDLLSRYNSKLNT